MSLVETTIATTYRSLRAFSYTVIARLIVELIVSDSGSTGIRQSVAGVLVGTLNYLVFVLVPKRYSFASRSKVRPSFI